jgi:exodeoxyribonuclease V beta subunit
MKSLKAFEVATVPLDGSNLIEASAGTGKTYSIAILLLRLLLEQRLAIREVLMVTFTKSAVAELEERARLFVRKAFQQAKGEGTDDTLIAALVDRAIAQEGAETIQQRLREAVLLLDETAVMTIHSFCQQTLGEFAFETGQLFGAETLKDPKRLVSEEVNSFWRRHITTIRVELLGILIAEGLRRDHIRQVVESYLSGRPYVSYQPGERYTFSAAEQQHAWDGLAEQVEAIKAAQERLTGYMAANGPALLSNTQSNANAVKSFLHLLDQPAAFIEQLIAKKSVVYVPKLYGAMLPDAELLEQVRTELKAKVRLLISHLYHMAITETSRAINAFKERNSLLSFDDMIEHLHRATLKDQNGRLRGLMQQKYRAVFIDEFQDTDRLQYELFNYFFGSDTHLFYIGDPKQSIYAFRKADIYTYFQASQRVANAYSMNTNYRSAPDLIAAMNTFFVPEAAFDTFYFQGAPEAIGYIPVQAPGGLEDMGLYKNNSRCVPITFFEAGKKEELAEQTAAMILDLLSDPAYKLRKKGSDTAIEPEMIGVLVRMSPESRAVKAALDRLGIPAVTVNEDKVLNSEEAKQVLHLLNAFIKAERGTINRALLAPFTGINREQLLQLDMDDLQTRFNSYGLGWERDGIYVTLTRFWQDHGVRQRLMNDREHSGERILTNLTQLTELLHNVQTRKQLVNTELINWFRRAVEGMPVEGDEYEQRVESDEQAVRIITIHKSKGLEYPIVFAPYLDLKGSDREFCTFRDADREEYLFTHQKELNDEQHRIFDLQQEQENRRLLYVAVTRAAYQLYIGKNTYTKLGETTLRAFYRPLKGIQQTLRGISFPADEGIPVHPAYKQDQTWRPVVPEQANNFRLAGLSWRKLSYTFLAAHQPYLPHLQETDAEDAYGQFIFRQLSRGAATGNFLHDVFERIDFQKEDTWLPLLEKMAPRYLPGYTVDQLPKLNTLISHTLHADIRVAGQVIRLSGIARSQRISELEFDFPVGQFYSQALQALSGSGHTILTENNRQVSGFMNGKIDLFFEWEGRYYILDWKSNFLGDHLDYYQPAVLTAAMNENNYHLQYLIYCLALRKYLELRLPDFNYDHHFGGVIYLFLRGVRTGSDTGIFTYRPEFKQIEQLSAILAGIGFPTG